jgi:hypothetical protein
LPDPGAAHRRQHTVSKPILDTLKNWQITTEGDDASIIGNPKMNQEHLDRLADGIAAWNSWREEHPAIEIDVTLSENRALHFVY